jgi:hypothetical protein
LIPFTQEQEVMNRAVRCLLVVALLGAPALAQDKFTIRLKTSAKGDIIQVSEKLAFTEKSTLTVMDKPQLTDKDKIWFGAFMEEIIEKEPGKMPAKLKRTYQKAEMTIQGKKFTPSVIGKEVLIDLTGPAPVCTMDGKELAGDDLVFMAEGLKDRTSQKDENGTFEQIILPKNPVAVGETWKPDMAALLKKMSEDAPMTFDAANSTATGKLLKAYTKDGRQFGAFEVALSLTLTKVGPGPMAFDLDRSSTLKITMRRDGCIDGTSITGTKEMILDTKMAGVMKGADGVQVKLDGIAKFNGSKTVEDSIDKK